MPFFCVCVRGGRRRPYKQTSADVIPARPPLLPSRSLSRTPPLLHPQAGWVVECTSDAVLLSISKQDFLERVDWVVLKEIRLEAQFRLSMLDARFVHRKARARPLPSSLHPPSAFSPPLARFVLFLPPSPASRRPAPPFLFRRTLRPRRPSTATGATPSFRRCRFRPSPARGRARCQGGR